MQRITEQAQCQTILQRLHGDIPNCVYMYIDLAKYGLGNPDLTLWEENDAVIMRYFDSIQVYGLTEATADAVAQHILQQSVPMVTGTEEDCLILQPLLGSEWISDAGRTYEVTAMEPCPTPDVVSVGSPSDLAECARLVCSDAGIGGHYQVASLTRQFQERFAEGMSRHRIIRQDGRIVGHIATYAEFADIAVSSGLIVAPEYRGRQFGKILETYLIHELLAEGKRVFTFLRSEQRYSFFAKHAKARYWANGKLTRVT